MFSFSRKRTFLILFYYSDHVKYTRPLFLYVFGHTYEIRCRFNDEGNTETLCLVNLCKSKVELRMTDLEDGPLCYNIKRCFVHK